MDTKLAKILSRPTLEVAQSLLGLRLCTKNAEGLTSGTIIEVEAYGATPQDEACHAHRGRTPRNQVMFRSSGYCYVYFIYGMHFCVNVVTEAEGTGAAVLIRALKPDQGLDLMRQRRGVQKPEELCDGPGKLCQALAIGRDMNGEHLLGSSRIWLEEPNPPASSEVSIKQSTRVGIAKSKELLWRFGV